MSPEVQPFVDAIRFVLFSMTFGGGLVLQEKLANAQKAVRQHGSQKAIAIDAKIPESRLAAKLNATGADVLNLRDLDKMPIPVQQSFHFFEVMRLGLPAEIRKALKVARVVRRVRVQQKRSA